MSRITIAGPRAGVRRGAAPRVVLMTLAGALLIGIGLHVTGRSPFAANRPPAAAVGSPAPDFELEEVGTGKKIRLSAMRGKPVILNFWCGCQLCRGVAIKWSEAKEKIPDVHLLTVIGDHSAYNPVSVKDFRWGTGYEGPILADVGTHIGVLYKSLDCPRCWVIDAGGIIRSVNKERMDPPDTIVNGALAMANSLVRR